jgi:16S rRNA (adenine1518-N6/adenine1519-N6)-dimethyltransferase
MYPKPKKYLGQNFLFDKNIQRKIVNSCEFRSDDIVLEIGSGRGELTALIKNRVKKIYALEIDRSLCDILKNEFKAEENLKIIHKDILKLNFNYYFKKITQKYKLKVVGNIPYYITTPIIAYLLRYRDKISEIFITVQKEFAARMIAKKGSKDYGAFSCFLQYYTTAQVLFLIKKNSFFPAPKVDSSFMKLKIRQSPAVRVKHEKILFKIIRGAFNKRRKTLRNSLQGIVSPKKLTLFFDKFGIDINIRPEQLSLEDFANLANL